MPLTRYQIRNEFSLADPELYGAADKDDPEALLEGVAMAGLVGVLRQLGDLAEFAAEIFHDLHEEVMVTSARGHGLMARVQQLEADFPSMEKAFLSQTSHSSFFYNTGMDWHPNLHMDQNLIMQKDLPRFVMDSYEECRGPPRLFLLDKFDIAGAGACLKRYTDPSLFKVESSSYGMANSEVQREKKNRKVKKKGSRWKNGETPEVLPTSHAKLHQLFLEERVESGISDPARRVKLKRRLNGFPFDTKSGKSYMEKFLETSSPDHKVVHEISVSSSPKRLPSNVTYDSGLEILDISVVSEDEESKQRMRSPSYSPNVEEGIVRRPLMDGNGEDFTDHNVLDGPEPISSFGTDKVTSRLHKAVGEKDITIDGGSQAEGSVDGYQSDGNASEIDNYMDALATIESEMETESERRANSGMSFLNAEMQGTDSDGNEEQLLSHFSDSQSIGHSTTSDDWNSLAKKNISSFSSSDSPSTSTENTPLDDAPSVSAKVFTSSETRDSEIIYKSSEDPSNDQEVSVDQVPKHIFSGSESLEVGDISIEGAESGEPCSSSCLMNSGTIEQEGMVVKPDLDEVMPKCDTVNTESVNSEKSGRNINDSLPGTSDLPHASIAFAEKHPVDEYADEIQNAYSDNISIPLKKKSENSLDDGLHEEYANEEYAKNGFTKDLIDSQGSSPNLVISHTEGQFLDPEVETCDPDIKPNDEVSEANKAVPSAVEIEDSTPAVDSPATPNFTMQAVAEITGDNKQHELDSAEEVACYSTESDVIEAEAKAEAYSEKHFGEISETTPKMDVLGFDERKTEVAQLESLAVSVAGAGAGPLDDAGGVDGSSPSMDATNFQNESFFNQSISDLEVNDTAQACVPQNNVEQVNKFTDASPDLDSSLCRTDSGHHSESEILNSVLDSSLDSEVKNDSHLDGDSIVPSSSENRALDSESNSSSKACLIEDSEVKNDSHLDGDSIVPSSSENRVLDSESNSSSKACLIENTVDGDAPSPALLKAPCPESVISSIVSIDLSESEFLNANMSPSSETNAWEQVNLIGKGEDVSSLPVHHFAETSVPSEQNVVSESLHPIAWKQANLPETNAWEQANLIEKGEDVSSLPGHHFEETSVPSEQNVVSESLYPIESCSESFFKLEQMKSSIEMDQESFLPDLPGRSSLSELLPEPDTNKPDMSEQATNSSRPAFASFSLLPVATFDEMPPMPPLPPVQWIMGKLQPASQEERNTIHPNVGPVPSEMPSAASGEKIIQSSNPFTPPPTSVKDENFQVPFGHFSLETTNVGNIENGHDDFLPSDRTQSRNPFLELPETQLETPEPGLHTGSSGAMQPSSISSSPVTTPNGLHTSSCGTMQPSSISQSTVTTTNVDATSTYTSEFSHGNSFQPPHNVPPETSLRDEKLECSSSGISEIEEVKPDNAIVPPTMEDEQAQPIFPISKREIAWPYAEEGKPNEIRPTKLLRPRSPFIDAVAAHDKSKLRKVSERVRPEVQKVEERDSLLEQIRTKSFNLKPAAMARPPSFQGPRTNLRVAALLEKANAIRQAFAGSDEDEDDDSWSDS